MRNMMKKGCAGGRNVGSCAGLAAGVVSLGGLSGGAVAQVTVQTVPITFAGNSADPATGFGAVPYEYAIARHEVTNAQYAAFLNVKAALDPHGLYNTEMAGFWGGIMRTGDPGAYAYPLVPGRENVPVNYVSFWDAIRFANWLHNGQGPFADTETGAYTITPQGVAGNWITRNTTARWAVPREDEWYKAAYYQPFRRGGDVDNYWLYGTSSNTISNAQANYGNFNNGYPVAVGSYAPNFFGVFDMAGNVWEWNESILLINDRGLRGGSSAMGFTFMAAISRNSNFAFYEQYDIGFRVAEVEPCRADFNGDGAIDFFDYLDFIAAYELELRSADFNGDTVVDFFDYLDFVAALDTFC